MSDHIDKIKKLLRLAQNKAASPAEAANALRRALELVDRHNLDIESLNLDEEAERLFRSFIPMPERRSFIKREVNGILLNHFHVRTCWEYRQLSIMGFEHDVTIAGYVFDFLVRACSKALSEFVAQERKFEQEFPDVVTIKPPKIQKNTNALMKGWHQGQSVSITTPLAGTGKEQLRLN